MKVLFLPLKIATEVVWRITGALQRATGWPPAPPDMGAPSPGARGPAGAPAAPTGEGDTAGAARPWSSPRGGGGAGSAAMAAYRSSAAAEAPAAPAPTLVLGARARLTANAAVQQHVVPAGSVGHIEGVHGDHFDLLCYSDDGVPLLVKRLSADVLRLA